LPRLLLTITSVLLTLAIGEGALRLWSFRGVERALRSRSADGKELSARRVLCVGDSYTFGVHYRAEESYPGRLEQWLGCGGGERWSVINAGIPAQNSAQVAASLPELLEAHAPQAVVVLVGYNNRWNMASPGKKRRAALWFEDLILVRLVRIVLAREPGEDRLREFRPDRVTVVVGGAEQSIEVNKTLDRAGDEAVLVSCKGDLAIIVELCRARSCAAILCTYPSPEAGYHSPSQAAREVALELGSPLVDFRELFAQGLKTHPYQHLLIPGDRHPTEAGYFWMARAVGSALVAARLTEDSVQRAALPEVLYPATLFCDEKRILQVTGPPGSSFRALVAESSEPPQSIGFRVLPLADDEVFRKFRDHESLAGKLDAEGRASVALPAELLSFNLRAALVVLHDQQVAAPDLRIRAIAGPVAVPVR